MKLKNWGKIIAKRLKMKCTEKASDGEEKVIPEEISLNYLVEEQDINSSMPSSVVNEVSTVSFKKLLYNFKRL